MRLHPGEIEATGWHPEPLASVVSRLLEASPDVVGRPRVVAVDGRGGAGKTVLVGRLRAAVEASVVVHTDDVAWNLACFGWGQALLAGVLEPVHQGRAVDFRPAPWDVHARPGSITVPSGLAVVWVEGTGIVREELAEWIDASIYVQADLDVQEARLRARDGDDPAVPAQVASWLEEELPFLTREQPWARATVVADGASDLPHDPDTEIVVARAAAPIA